MNTSSMDSVNSNTSNTSIELKRKLFQGVVIGSLIPFIINPFEKTNTRFQTNTSKGPFFSALKIHPFKGVRVAILNGLTKNVIMFPSIPLFNYLTTKAISNPNLSELSATGCASAFTTILISPLQVMKVRIYTQDVTTVKGVWHTLPADKRIRSLFAGTGTALVKNTLYWPIFFGITKFVNDRLKSQTSTVISSGVSGYIGALTAVTITYPWDVLSKIQKAGLGHGTTIQTAKHILKMEGYKTFFKGFFKVHATRVLIAGPATSLVMSSVNFFFNESKKNTALITNEITDLRSKTRF